MPLFAKERRKSEIDMAQNFDFHLFESPEKFQAISFHLLSRNELI